MENKFIGLVVGLCVGVLLLAGLLAPLAAEATSPTSKFENSGYFYMKKITAEDPETYTFEYSYTNGVTTISFNGEPVNLGGMTNPVTLATDGEDWFVRYGLNNEYVGLQIFGTDLVLGGYSVTPLTIELNRGTVTATGYIDGSETPEVKTKTYTEAYIYSPDKSDYVMKKADSAAYLLKDSEYIAVGQTTIKEWFDALKITGTVENFDVGILIPEKTITVSNKVVDAETVSGYEDLYSLSKLTFTVGYDDASTDATYSYFIVPAEITAEKTNHLDTTQTSLILASVTIAFVVLIAFAAFAVRGRMND